MLFRTCVCMLTVLTMIYLFENTCSEREISDRKSVDGWFSQALSGPS